MNRTNLIHLFKDKYDITYLTEDGIEYRTDEDFLESFLIEVFNFCGCGSLLDGTGVFLKQVLNAFDDDYLSLDKIEDICKTNEIVDFTLHFLDANELTDHGTSIYGSWLTEKGIALRECLNEVLKR